MQVSFYLPLWPFALYLTVGLILWLPLERIAWKQIHRRGPFWPGLWAGIKRRPITVLVTIIAWPLAIKEVM